MSKQNLLFYIFLYTSAQESLEIKRKNKQTKIMFC